MSKQVAEKKPSFFSAVAANLRGTRAEMKKVHWSNRAELISYTGIVISSVLIVAVVLWLADSVFSYVLQLLMK